MAKLTITESLAELKTIFKRLEKKRQAVLPYLARDLRVKDPFEAKGGSSEFIRAERQGIQDLQERTISIRTAIQKSDLETQISVGGKTRSVSDWLTWRREVSDGEKNFLTTLVAGLKNFRNEIQRKGGSVKPSGSQVENYDPTAPPEMVVNVDEKFLLEQQENIETVLGELDGKLSLLNATTFVDV